MDIQYIMSIIQRDSLGREIEEKLRYFFEYYEFAGRRMESGSLPFYPLLPHTIFRMLQEELQREKNGRNLEFLGTRLEKVVGRDKVCQEQFGFLKGLLMEHLVSDKEYALHVCQEILDRMETENYAGSLCGRLEEILFDGKTLAERKEEIRYLVEALLTEQQLYGYSIKSIQQLPNKLLQGWGQVRGIIYTDYPFAPVFEGADRSLRVREYMEELTVRDRIRDLARLFDKQEQTYILVCGISGMKGDEIDFEIGNVKIYNAKFHPKFAFEKENGTEEKNGSKKEGLESAKIKCLIHAAVTVRGFDQENFIPQAKREVEKAIDIICCYSDIHVPIHIDMSVYQILDEQFQPHGAGMRAEGEAFLREMMGINYDRGGLGELQELYLKYSSSVLAGEGELPVVIQNAARWFRKGKETQRPEDKLLNDWICLESLFPNQLELPKEIGNKLDDRKSKFNQIYGLVPVMLIRKRFFEYFWKCQNDCLNLYFQYNNRKDNNVFPISEELAKKCDFKLEGQINLLPFLESLGEIVESIPDGVFKDYLEEVRSCVEDAKAVNRLWKKLEARMEEELLMGYRLRNIIVHNAQSSTDYVEYYETQLRRISGDVIRLIIHLYEEHPSRTMADILQRENIENREMKKQVEKEGVITWIQIHG